MKYIFKAGIIIPIVSLILITSCYQQKSHLKLPSLFADNMILQQNSTTPFWGWSIPGTKINIRTSWGEEVSAIATEDGKWMVNVITPETNN